MLIHEVEFLTKLPLALSGFVGNMGRLNPSSRPGSTAEPARCPAGNGARCTGVLGFG